MRRRSGTLTLLIPVPALFTVLACGGTTVKSANDSGVRDQDTGVPRDSGSDAQKLNDGGIINDASPGECPATYAIGAMAATCNTYPVCIYDEGTCVCGEPGPPHEGPSTWYCTLRPAGCPYGPPAQNSACSDNSLSCDYGACSGGTDWTCSGGVWTQGAIGCPL